jgi:hypothetical protein
MRFNIVDQFVLLMGTFLTIFNRFVAQMSIDYSTDIMGIDLGDPVKAKRLYSSVFAAVGLLTVISTLLEQWFPIAHSFSGTTSSNLPKPLLILCGVGALVNAMLLIVFRRTAVDLTTKQANELLGPSVSEQLVNYVLLSFHGMFLLLGAVLVGTALMY